ncbi:MAG: CAP domain-containing protein [Chloroflexota bacterium]
MRLHLAVPIACLLMAVLLYLLNQPALSKQGDQRNQDHLLDRISSSHPLTTTTPTASPVPISPTLQISPTSTVVAPTITPTSTPNTALMPPTPTLTPTVMVTPTVTPTSIHLSYVPALIHSEQETPIVEPAELCGPSVISTLPELEPTSTPIPTSTPNITETISLTNTQNITIPVNTPTICPPNVHEAALAELFVNSPEQQRPTLNYNPILAQVAREHAADMIARNYVSSVSPDGIGSNQRVRQSGYALPDFYDPSPGANNVETIYSGYMTAEALWEVAVNSQSIHVLGTNEFYQSQSEYGIGYAYRPGSTYQRYWVIITAEPAEAEPTSTASD